MSGAAGSGFIGKAGLPERFFRNPFFRESLRAFRGCSRRVARAARLTGSRVRTSMRRFPEWRWRWLRRVPYFSVRTGLRSLPFRDQFTTTVRKYSRAAAARPSRWGCSSRADTPAPSLRICVRRGCDRAAVRPVRSSGIRRDALRGRGCPPRRRCIPERARSAARRACRAPRATPRCAAWGRCRAR